MKRKLLLILSLCFVAACSALIFTACETDNQGSGGNSETDNQGSGGNSETDCVHEYISLITQPTCTEQGFTKYTCLKCNDTYVDNYVDSLGHDYLNHEAKEATCTEIGWNAYKTCSRCDYSNYEEIPAIMAHEYENNYCKWCNEQEPTLDCLTFTLNSNSTYIVNGLYKTITKAIIPSLYNGKLVTSIGASAFNGCSSMTSVTIPNSITTIGEYAFTDCTSLENITLPNSVISINEGAFRGCTSLTSVIVGNNRRLKYISNRTFSGCSSLENITIPNSITSIGEYAFFNCDSLTSIVIPDNVTAIGWGAFQSCDSLTSITIPNSVTSIGRSAFGGCTSLTSVIVGDNSRLNYIGRQAFDGCTSLTNVTIPDNVTTIDFQAFRDCTSLTSIIIPKSVTSIDGSAFGGCTSLTIYCESVAELIGWANGWNSGCPVVWGYKGEN